MNFKAEEVLDLGVKVLGFRAQGVRGVWDVGIWGLRVQDSRLRGRWDFRAALTPPAAGKLGLQYLGVGVP